MDNTQNEKVIYLEINDDITSIIEKLQQTPDESIILVIPRRSTLTRSIINFKILKDEAELYHKRIHIATSDKLGQSLAVQAGLSIQEIQEASAVSENPAPAEPVSQGEKVNISYNIADLREKPQENDNFEIEMHKDLEMTPRVSPRSEAIHPEQSAVSDIVKKTFDAQQGSANFLDKSINEHREIPIDHKVMPLEIRRLAPEELPAMAMPSRAADNRMSVSRVSSATKKIFFAFLACCVIAAIAVVVIVLPKAKISIVPKVEPLVVNVDVVVDPAATAVDVSQQKIPGKNTKVTKSKSQEFPATGKKKLADKAKGVITVYNEWSTSPQVLVENTRFLSKENKQFRTKKAIVIPGMQRVEGEDVPGTNDVEVEAQEAGESYNIDATSFTIPGFTGSIKYSTIYGRSKSKMTGGSTAEVKVVTVNDIASARDTLIKGIGEEMNAQTKQDTPREYVVIDDSIQTKIDDFQTDANSDAVKDKFTAKITASSNALIFKKDDIDMLVGEFIKSKLGEGKTVISENSSNVTYKFVSVDKDNKMLISTHIEKEVGWKIDSNDLKDKIKGKNKAELDNIFGNITGIKDAKVWFYPVWVNSVPQNDSQIEISIDKNN